MHRGMRRNPGKDGEQNSSLQVFQARLGTLDQPNAAAGFCQHAVVIVFEPSLRALVAQPLQIGEPAKFRGGQLKPIRQRANGFDARDGPVLRRGHRLHRLQAGDPVQYFDLMPVFVRGIYKARVRAKKADQVTPSRTNASSEGFDIPSRKRPDPAPVTAQNVGETGRDGIPLLLAAEDRVG